MCDITAEGLGRLQASLDRIEALLADLAGPALPLFIDEWDQTGGHADRSLPPRMAEVIPIDTVRR
jgi:hypothetical protein